MKFFLSIALIVAVASAGVLKPVSQTAEVQQIQEIIAAINSPNTDPATAALLEQQLFEVLGVGPISVGPAIINPISPISVGPAIVEGLSPISVGPAIIDFPLPEGALGEVVPSPGPVVPVAPVVEAPTPVAPAATADNSPLVQIIVNVNGAAAGANPVTVTPGGAAESVVEPVQVVEEAEFIPAPVVLPPPPAVFPLPIVAPEPVIVVEAPKPEPISVGTPVFPVPVAPVVLPETLN